MIQVIHMQFQGAHKSDFVFKELQRDTKPDKQVKRKRPIGQSNKLPATRVSHMF